MFWAVLPGSSTAWRNSPDSSRSNRSVFSVWYVDVEALRSLSAAALLLLSSKSPVRTAIGLLIRPLLMLETL